jgi:hypothetical protein
LGRLRADSRRHLLPRRCSLLLLGQGEALRRHRRPPAIEKKFEGTFLITIPGVDAAWTILGILEFAIFVLMVASLITLEFLPGKRKPLLVSGLALAIFTFSILGIGQNVVAEFERVAALFLYAGATGVLLGLVLNLPPYRAPNWLSGRVEGG